MSNTYFTLVPVDIMSDDEAKLIHDRIFSFLVCEKIIEQDKTDCVLGDLGYPPGDNYESVFEESIKTGGLEITFGRTVFHSSHLEEVCCPKCGENLIDSNWSDKLSEWYKESHDDLLKCTNCKQECSIIEYRFNPNWAFGHYGLVFWDWGINFRDDFIKSIENAINRKLNTVDGRI